MAVTVTVSRYRWPLPLPLAVTVGRYRLPSPLGVAVTVAVAVGLAVEPVGFDGFFRAYGLYGRIMRMGGALSITRRRVMRALWGFGGIAIKTPPKKGGAWQREISPKRRVSTKKNIKKSFKNFCFFLFTPTSP